ncbi:MAG: Diguanylate cyclase, partial [uncultured Pseudonocardia sp.]
VEQRVRSDGTAAALRAVARRPLARLGAPAQPARGDPPRRGDGGRPARARGAAGGLRDSRAVVGRGCARRARCRAHRGRPQGRADAAPDRQRAPHRHDLGLVLRRGPRPPRGGRRGPDRRAPGAPVRAGAATTAAAVQAPLHDDDDGARRPRRPRRGPGCGGARTDRRAAGPHRHRRRPARLHHRQRWAGRCGHRAEQRPARPGLRGRPLGRQPPRDRHALPRCDGGRGPGDQPVAGAAGAPAPAGAAPFGPGPAPAGRRGHRRQDRAAQRRRVAHAGGEGAPPRPQAGCAPRGAGRRPRPLQAGQRPPRPPRRGPRAVRRRRRPARGGARARPGRPLRRRGVRRAAGGRSHGGRRHRRAHRGRGADPAAHRRAPRGDADARRPAHRGRPERVGGRGVLPRPRHGAAGADPGGRHRPVRGQAGRSQRRAGRGAGPAAGARRPGRHGRHAL